MKYFTVKKHLILYISTQNIWSWFNTFKIDVNLWQAMLINPIKWLGLGDSLIITSS